MQKPVIGLIKVGINEGDVGRGSLCMPVIALSLQTGMKKCGVGRSGAGCFTNSAAVVLIVVVGCRSGAGCVSVSRGRVGMLWWLVWLCCDWVAVKGCVV